MDILSVKFLGVCNKAVFSKVNIVKKTSDEP